MEDLIFFIVDELYGKDPGTVSRILYTRNKYPFKSLLIASKMTEQQLRNALVILIQQQLVTYEEKPKILYTLSIPDVLKRIRYPRYIRLIHLKYGDNSCIEELLENGCASINSLVASCKDTHRQAQNVTQTLREMIINGYLVPTDLKADVTQTVVQINNLPKAGKPRKKAKIEIGEGIKAAEALPKPNLDTVTDTFYKLNMNKLDKEMACEIISKYVSSKCNLNCVIVAETLFRLGYRSVTKAELSSQLPSIPKISASTLDQSLETLEKTGIVIKDTEISWKINLNSIYNNLAASVLEKIIQGKFGDYSGRVFRILYNKGLLDDKSISDLTLLPLKETNTCVNELFAAGFVYSKVVGVNQMHFGVRIDDVKEDILRQSYKSVLNLKIKLASEMEEVWGLVQHAGHLTNDERNALERYKMIEARIESAILEVDRTIMILSLQ